MIRLLHTESSMNLGGQELRVLAEMEGLESMGYVSALAARPGSRILNEAKARGLTTYPVAMRGSIDPFAVYAMMRIMAREHTDIVNTHGSKDGWCAGLAAKLTGRMVVRSRHVANPIRSHFFGRMVYGPLCDRVVTTSESIKRGMVERGVNNAKITSVPTGIDPDRFRHDAPKGAFRAEMGVPDNVRLVGMVSVMRGDKGPDVFVAAAEAVLAKREDVRFVLVGDGWMKERIEEMVVSSVHKDGIVIAGYRRDIPSVLADLDVFALPARAPEGVPQAVLQAHLMKVPVVASEVGGINEVAINGENALTVPPGEPGRLADAIIRLLDDRTLSDRLTGAGHAMVMERYTSGRMLYEMDRLYRETLGDGGRV